MVAVGDLLAALLVQMRSFVGRYSLRLPARLCWMTSDTARDASHSVAGMDGSECHVGHTCQWLLECCPPRSACSQQTLDRPRRFISMPGLLTVLTSTGMITHSSFATQSTSSSVNLLLLDITAAYTIQ